MNRNLLVLAAAFVFASACAETKAWWPSTSASRQGQKKMTERDYILERIQRLRQANPAADAAYSRQNPSIADMYERALAENPSIDDLVTEALNAFHRPGKVGHTITIDNDDHLKIFLAYNIYRHNNAANTTKYWGKDKSHIMKVQMIFKFFEPLADAMHVVASDYLQAAEALKRGDE